MVDTSNWVKFRIFFEFSKKNNNIYKLIEEVIYQQLMIFWKNLELQWVILFSMVIGLFPKIN